MGALFKPNGPPGAPTAANGPEDLGGGGGRAWVVEVGGPGWWWWLEDLGGRGGKT